MDAGWEVREDGVMIMDECLAAETPAGAETLPGVR
jgi:hypothetical protein